MVDQGLAGSIRRDILAGRLAAGSELRQTDLANQFGVSRIPIRDALGILTAEGLVVARPNRSARVLSLTLEEVSELYAIRRLLECDCLRLAMTRASDRDREEALRELRRSNLDVDTETWPASDWAFHQALYIPSGRRQQIDLIARLRTHCRVHIAAYDSLRQGTANWLEDHAAIVDAYLARDIDRAVSHLGKHLEKAGNDLIGAMRQETQHT